MIYYHGHQLLSCSLSLSSTSIGRELLEKVCSMISCGIMESLILNLIIHYGDFGPSSTDQDMFAIFTCMSHWSSSSSSLGRSMGMAEGWVLDNFFLSTSYFLLYRV